MKRICLLLLSVTFLSGCFDTTLKKSANNKLIDNKGFHGGKRRPLYNKKYIDKAKLHVARGDFEEEEYDDEEQYLENLPPQLKNRYMYEDMIEEDLKAEREKRAKKKSKYLRRLRGGDNSYPDLGKEREKVRAAQDESGSHELKKELKEIKTLLDAARADLVKYRCPIDENGNPTTPMKHDVKPKKIHEQVKEEEKNKVAKNKPASKPAPKTVDPKPEPKSQPVAKKTVAAPAPVAKAPVAQKAPSAPKPVAPTPAPTAPVASVQEKVHKPHSHDNMDHSHHGSHDHAHPHPHPQPQKSKFIDPQELVKEPEVIKQDEGAQTIPITPSREEVKELSIPQITEIPPAQDDEFSGPEDVPDLPSFPTQ